MVSVSSLVWVLFSLFSHVIGAPVDGSGEITGDLGDGRQFNPATVTFKDYAFAYRSDQCCAKCQVENSDTQLFVFSETSMFCGCYKTKEGVQTETWNSSSISDENERIPSPVAGVCEIVKSQDAGIVESQDAGIVESQDAGIVESQDDGGSFSPGDLFGALLDYVLPQEDAVVAPEEEAEVKEVAVVDPSVAVAQEIVEEEPIVLDASGTASLSESLPPSKLPEALALTTTKKECSNSDFDMDTDYPGNDFNVAEARSTHRQLTAMACQKLCNETAKCKYFTWSLSNLRCYMKTTKSGTSKEKGAISGPKNCE